MKAEDVIAALELELSCGMLEGSEPLVVYLADLEDLSDFAKVGNWLQENSSRVPSHSVSIGLGCPRDPQILAKILSLTLGVDLGDPDLKVEPYEMLGWGEE